jgi:hypothetical protein
MCTTGINDAGLITGFWSDTNTGTDSNFAVLFDPIVSRVASISVVDPRLRRPRRAGDGHRISGDGRAVACFQCVQTRQAITL